MPDKLNLLQEKLLTMRAELAALIESTEDSRAPVELDQTLQGRLSRQDALMQQEMAKESHRRRELELKRINAALERMEKGDYGYCVRCDEEIAEKRLALDPATPVCVNCAG